MSLVTTRTLDNKNIFYETLKKLTRRSFCKFFDPWDEYLM